MIINSTFEHKNEIDKDGNIACALLCDLLRYNNDTYINDVLSSILDNDKWFIWIKEYDDNYNLDKDTLEVDDGKMMIGEDAVALIIELIKEIGFKNVIDKYNGDNYIWIILLLCKYQVKIN